MYFFDGERYTDRIRQWMQGLWNTSTPKIPFEHVFLNLPWEVVQPLHGLHDDCLKHDVAQVWHSLAAERTKPEERDAVWMLLAYMVALTREGYTHPNPPVGAVLIDKEKRVWIGVHAQAGAPHAEAAVIRAAGVHAQGASLYVTLEPCNHVGRTAACSEAIMHAGIRRVVYGTKDPNPQVKGGGALRLEQQGIQVACLDTIQPLKNSDSSDVILMAQHCRMLIDPFVSLKMEKRPRLISKVATSADGFIAPLPNPRGTLGTLVEDVEIKTRQPYYLTGEYARQMVHRLRACMDGIVVGESTLRGDNPRLNVRLDSMMSLRHPDVFVLLSSKHRIEESFWRHQAFEQERSHYIVSTYKAVTHKPSHINWLYVPANHEGSIDLNVAWQAIAEESYSSLLVEPGARFYKALIEQSLSGDLLARFYAALNLKEGIILPDLKVEDHGWIQNRNYDVGEDSLFVWKRT